MQNVDRRTPDEVRQHYEVEVELAARLRGAAKAERLAGLYASIYKERIERIPAHPLTIQASDPKTRERSVRPQLRLLLPWLTPETVFMEVGPGDCALASAVAPHVKTVYAVDVTDALVPAAEPRGNYRFASSNGVSIPVPAQTVDVAYSNQVLEHLHPDDAHDHLSAIHAALAPGGRFICITPNRLSGPWDVSRHFDAVPRGLHLREYSLSELMDLLRSVGFEVHLFASYQGRRIAPVIPEWPIRAYESSIGPQPRAIRRRLAWPLTAVKVMGLRLSM